MENNTLHKQIIKQCNEKNIEWVDKRYKDDKNLTHLEGHAQKHLIKKMDESKKWQMFENIDIKVPFKNLVKQYEQISIDNVYNNKTNYYYDRNNKSINICDNNNLETCLKYSVSKQKLVISSCFYRDKIREIINNLNLKLSDVGKTKFFTMNDINEENNYNNQECNSKKMCVEIIEALKENQDNNIKDMVDSYVDNKKYDTERVKTQIKEIVFDIDKEIDYIKNLAHENNFLIKEYEHKDYKKDFCSEYSDVVEIDYLDIDNIFDESNNNKFELDYYEIVDYIKLLLIYYIYLILANENIELYYKRICIFSQLESIFPHLYEIITVLEQYIKVSAFHNNNLYTHNAVYFDYINED